MRSVIRVISAGKMKIEFSSKWSVSTYYHTASGENWNIYQSNENAYYD